MTSINCLKCQVYVCSLLLSVNLLSACDSDEIVQENGTSSSGEPETTLPFEPGTTTEEPPPDPPFPSETSITCRDVIECLALIALDGITAEDIESFIKCQDGLTDEQEAIYLIDLLSCVGFGCTEAGLCKEEQTLENSLQCFNCFSINILSPFPPGCEQEAAMCK